MCSMPAPRKTPPVKNVRTSIARAFQWPVPPSHSGRAVPPMDIALIEAMAKTRKPTGDM